MEVATFRVLKEIPFDRNVGQLSGGVMKCKGSG